MAAQIIEWKEQITAWQESGLTKAEYCRQHNLSYSAFIRQTHKKEESNPPVRRTSGFVRIAASTLIAGCAINDSGIHLSIGGVSIELDKSFDRDDLQTVIEVLHACA